jgi:hypothetical protein
MQLSNNIIGIAFKISYNKKQEMFHGAVAFSQTKSRPKRAANFKIKEPDYPSSAAR